MSDYKESLIEEKKYLHDTLEFIKKEIESETKKLDSKKLQLIEMKRQMMQETGGVSAGYQGLAENSQYLSEVNSSTAIYNHIIKQIKKYRGLLDSPYFGRIDFLEEGESLEEKLYIGLSTVIDSNSNQIYVYDWRAPISSMYYQYGRGQVEYTSPMGNIKGIITLKRQYKIKNSELIYFFDSDMAGTDKILQEMLSQSKSGRMKNIVETIQKDQDAIIRDNKHDLLIVQGVAGSGKTSIALHRIAYLLYNGMYSNLKASDVVIISPNDVFSEYISNILPELGEDNVIQLTFYDLARDVFKERFILEKREAQLESLINLQETEYGEMRKKIIDFKGSRVFIQILDRLVDYYARHDINFQDIYYDGKTIMTRQQLKNRFLNNKFNIPMAKQLKRVEETVLDKIRPLQAKRYEKIKEIVDRSEGRDFEVESFSRLLSIKYSKPFLDDLRKNTQADYFKIYKILLENPHLLIRLSKNLKIPENVESLMSCTRDAILRGHLPYEDIAPLMYLKLKIEGDRGFNSIRQVVIDEAQDYYPVHYQVFNMLFSDSKYTLLGDVNQAIDKNYDYSLYDEISLILAKEKNVKYINRSYRSSYEISKFNQKLLGKKHIAFRRHGQEPEVLKRYSEEQILMSIVEDIEFFRSSGYQSVGVICKNQSESEKVYLELKSRVENVTLGVSNKKLGSGVVIIPGYFSKGLEFDIVIVYNANKSNYHSDFDKRLLYVACTRALHYLKIYFVEEKTLFIG